MIEINLIPDVKLELLKARRQRSMVISASILAAIVAGGAVVLLAFYAFGVQTVASTFADNAIKDENQKLQAVGDLSKTLTIQNQLGTLDSQHDEKTVSSRVFDIIGTAVPRGENTIGISRLSLNTEDNTIDIEGEARNGYEALEVFKKTLARTTFSYSEDGDAAKPINIASTISDGDRRYGENSEGQRVLRFSLSFTYPDELFSPTAEQGRISAPDRQNATDSARGVPSSLFTDSPSTEDN